MRIIFLLLCMPFAMAFTPPTAVSLKSPSKGDLATQAKYCYDLNETAQTDWRLPEIPEITYFAGTITDTDMLWTTTTDASWFLLFKPSVGVASKGGGSEIFYVRCVR